MNGLRVLVGTALTFGALVAGLAAPGAASAAVPASANYQLVDSLGFCGEPGSDPCDGICLGLHEVCVLGSGGQPPAHGSG